MDMRFLTACRTIGPVQLRTAVKARRFDGVAMCIEQFAFFDRRTYLRAFDCRSGCVELP